MHIKEMMMSESKRDLSKLLKDPREGQKSRLSSYLSETEKRKLKLEEEMKDNFTRMPLASLKI